MKVLVETSARHIHLTNSDLEILFGKNAKLTPKKELSQPGQFACNERVTLIGPKRSIENIIIVGPTRSKSQIEISLTDARTVGISAPIRLSGNTKNAGKCKLIGPNGEIELEESVIIAKRHIHMHPTDANLLGVTENSIVMVKIKSNERTTIFDDVSIRINDNFKLAMHIDTDEANAAGCNGEVYGEIILKNNE